MPFLKMVKFGLKKQVGKKTCARMLILTNSSCTNFYARSSLMTTITFSLLFSFRYFHLKLRKVIVFFKRLFKTANRAKAIPRPTTLAFFHTVQLQMHILNRFKSHSTICEDLGIRSALCSCQSFSITVLTFRVAAKTGSTALTATPLTTDLVKAVATGGDTLTLELLYGGSVPYTQIKAFS